ncbi:hypothetical protein BDZ97DRAFT_2070421 [Flammula alnicola]|nr:hypothetical protein BDZ97DRAFT_2070421 [Flammula alnicola]
MSDYELTPEEIAEVENDPFADQHIDVIIREDIIPKLTPAQRRLFNGGPGSQKELEKKAERNRKVRERRAEARASKDAQARENPGSKRKARSLTPGEDIDDDNSSSKQPKFDRVAVYIQVERPSSAPPPSRGGKLKSMARPNPSPVQKGPFWLDADAAYDTFKSLLAKNLPCRPDHLPTVVTSVGYEALQESLKERHKDRVIIVYMPPPAQDDTTWDTGDDIATPFDYYEESATGETMELSAKAQIAAIGSQSADHLSILKAQYPTNNFPDLYPGKRMFEQKGSYWELTQLRLQIWANAMSTGSAGVSISQPPMSKHFDMDHRLKSAKSKHIQDENQAPPYHHVPGTPPQHQPSTYPYHFAMPPYAPPPYGYPAPYGYPPHAFPPYQKPPSPLISNAPPVLISPKAALRLKVPLSEFCTRYDLSESDQEKLLKLEYRPGNRVVEKLPESEWKDRGQFSFIGWETFLDAHRMFLEDAKDGKWGQPSIP